MALALSRYLGLVRSAFTFRQLTTVCSESFSSEVEYKKDMDQIHDQRRSKSDYCSRYGDGDAVLLASKERNDDSGEYAVLHSFKCRLQAQQLESSDTEILGASSPSMRRNNSTHTHKSVIDRRGCIPEEFPNGCFKIPFCRLCLGVDT